MRWCRATLHATRVYGFRISGLQPDSFHAELVYDFGSGAYLSVMVGHYWIQAIPSLRRVVALDISNAAKPFEISRVYFDDTNRTGLRSIPSAIASSWRTSR